MKEEVTLIPAYGRDYGSRAAVLADWEAERDFIIAGSFHRYAGKACNAQQFPAGARITFRYSRMREAFVYDHNPAREPARERGGE